MTSLSQDVLDAMRRWIVTRSPKARPDWWTDDAVAHHIDWAYPGGVSAFLSEHGGED